MQLFRVEVSVADTLDPFLFGNPDPDPVKWDRIRNIGGNDLNENIIFKRKVQANLTNLFNIF